MPESPTPFHDLGDYVAIPRLTGLVLSPDGGRLVASMQQLAADGDRYQTSLWEVDPAGALAARRLTHSEQGESEPAFAGDGSLLFTSKRPGPGDASRDEPALWRLPQRGEAVRIATGAAGLSGPVGAQASPAYVVATSRLAGATEETDQQWRSDRKDAKVSAIIHDGFPIRLWDHELGPDFPRLLAARTDNHADLTAWSVRLFGTPAEHPDWYAENSPHHFADAITTPMLIIHGNRDYRVPYSEGLRAFWDLVRHHGGDPATLPHRFLQFTGENHFVLSPGNARIWNETVLAFLEWHVLGGKWSPPRLA